MSEPSNTSDWILRPFGEDEKVEPIAVDVDTPVRVGRSADNELCLADREVSSHHLMISIDEEKRLVVEDLGSLNGTFVDGERVQRRVLAVGHVVRAGASGPGFVVERSAPFEGTVFTAGPAPGQEKKDRFGSSTMMFLRESLGIERDAGVTDIVQAHARKTRWQLVVVAIVLVVGFVAAFLWFRSATDEQFEDLSRHLRAELDETATRFTTLQSTWEEQRDNLRAEEQKLTVRLAEVERDEAASSEEIDRLQAQLRDTTDSLKKYDPVQLKQEQLRVLEDVRRAVVFIETVITMHDTKTDDPVRVIEEMGARRLGIGDDGELFTREGSGSGFVVSSSGWILTNAHVVQPDGYDDVISMPGGQVVEARLDVSVVFNGEAVRHRAEVVRAIKDEESGEDFALIRSTLR